MSSHQFHGSILREYDIRGILGETLFERDAEILGLVFGTLLLERGGRSVCVGFDGRLSSPALEAMLVNGLSRTGVAVKRVGLGPTPMLYFATNSTGADAGIMVTGSHNPPSHNGFKISLANRPFFGAQIIDIGHRAATGHYHMAESGGVVEKLDVKSSYLKALANAARGLIADEEPDLRVVWDPGNGAAGAMTQHLANILPGTHVVINGAIDGTFPNHHPDPTVAENLVQLKAAVAEHKAHIGIAFDGDGDRIGAINSNGQIIWGDQLIAILAREVLAAQPGATIIADVKTSQMTFDEIARLGGRPFMWRTGHSPIKQKMIEMKSPLAGEMSGHIFFADRYYGFDDALYAAVRLLNACQAGRGLDDILSNFPTFVNTPELRIGVPEDRKFAIIDQIKARVSESAYYDIVDIDGIRVNTADGWWLLRASNTQAAIVVRCEASSQDNLNKLIKVVSQYLSAQSVDVSAVADGHP